MALKTYITKTGQFISQNFDETSTDWSGLEVVTTIANALGSANHNKISNTITGTYTGIQNGYQSVAYITGVKDKPEVTLQPGTTWTAPLHTTVELTSGSLSKTGNVSYNETITANSVWNTHDLYELGAMIAQDTVVEASGTYNSSVVSKIASITDLTKINSVTIADTWTIPCNTNISVTSGTLSYNGTTYTSGSSFSGSEDGILTNTEDKWRVADFTSLLTADNVYLNASGTFDGNAINTIVNVTDPSSSYYTQEINLIYQPNITYTCMLTTTARVDCNNLKLTGTPSVRKYTYGSTSILITDTTGYNFDGSTNYTVFSGTITKPSTKGQTVSLAHIIDSTGYSELINYTNNTEKAPSWENYSPKPRVLYKNGIYVYADNMGDIYSSTDGTSWTKRFGLRTSSDNNYGTTALYYINGYFIALIHSLNSSLLLDIIARSTDGTSWTYASLPNGGPMYGYPASEIANNGTNLVTVDEYGQIYTSSNTGSSWTYRKESDHALYTVVYDSTHSKFITAGHYLYFGYSSNNGTSWTFNTKGSSGQYIYSLCCYNGTTVAVGNNDYFYYSTDGINWTAATVNWTGTHSATSTFKVVKYMNGMFIAMGGSDSSSSARYSVAYSTDGKTWTAYTVSNSNGLNMCFDFIYNNGMYVAAAEDACMMFSSDISDPSSWTIYRLIIGGVYYSQTRFSGICADANGLDIIAAGFVLGTKGHIGRYRFVPSSYFSNYTSGMIKATYNYSIFSSAGLNMRGSNSYSTVLSTSSTTNKVLTTTSPVTFNSSEHIIPTSINYDLSNFSSTGLWLRDTSGWVLITDNELKASTFRANITSPFVYDSDGHLIPAVFTYDYKQYAQGVNLCNSSGTRLATIYTGKYPTTFTAVQGGTTIVSKTPDALIFNISKKDNSSNDIQTICCKSVNEVSALTITRDSNGLFSGGDAITIFNNNINFNDGKPHSGRLEITDENNNKTKINFANVVKTTASSTTTFSFRDLNNEEIFSLASTSTTKYKGYIHISNYIIKSKHPSLEESDTFITKDNHVYTKEIREIN